MTEQEKYRLLTDAEGIRYERAKRANTAERVGKMFVDVVNAIESVSLDELKTLFLSKVAADVAAGKITFLQGLQSLGLAVFSDGATFGEFNAGMYAGTGAKIDSLGNAELESLKVRSSLEVLELLINRLAAIEGDQLLTEADTIESVTDLGDNCYRLQLRSKWDGYFTSMSPGAVLKGIYNSLAHAAETQSATVVGTENNADYYTSWMRVNSVNQAANSIEVALYPDAQVPSGTNHAPVELMNIARWGHQTDTSRQSCLYLSSTEGKIVKLKDVTAPIISESNIALSLGTIPQFVFDYLHGQAKPVTDKDDMLFADSIAVRNLYFYPKGDGTCEIEYVDRGSWQSGASYYHKAPGTLTNGKWEVSDVWHIGCRWRCLVNLTAEEPRWNSTDWAMIEGNRNFAIDFVEPFQLYDADNFNASLTIKAMLGYSDITDDIADADIAWSRRSWDAHGIERMSADTLWAISRAGTGKSIALTLADIGVDAAGWPSRLEITATATLRDGSQAQATFAYPL